MPIESHHLIVVLLAAMASKLDGCPVKLALEPTQLVGLLRTRPMTEQRVRQAD
ncbi:hypothetical protein [Massilia psychrophila]|jgi:hypothetical protein|uniref:hypothetical protein n=1 Tax=Massilia psychrophila TaxID=1603353 RepID=UPI0015D4CC9C|nr:hypothetical protein [Massilia psychrophila]GGE92756.1 hypothetical protein GCM10008020_42220 [Massilia psychrophila]